MVSTVILIPPLKGIWILYYKGTKRPGKVPDKACRIYFKRPVCVLCLAFAAVIYLMGMLFPPWAHAEHIRDSISDGTFLTVTGTLAGIEHKSFSTILQLKSISIRSERDIPDASSPLDGEVKGLTPQGMFAYLKTPEAAEGLNIGCRVLVTGEFSGFDSAENNGNFDAFRYYAIRGFEGRLKNAAVVDRSGSYSYISDRLFRLRERTREVFFSYLNEEEAGTLTALILGDKTGLDAEVKESYQSAGIAHILSLSGLHIATVGLLLFSALRRSGMRTWLSSAASGLVMLLYSIMTGMSVSTVRALIMFILGVTAVALKRTYDLLSAAALSSLIILLQNPGWIFDSGFLLSFTAVMGIGLIYPMLEYAKKSLCKGLHTDLSRSRSPLVRGLGKTLEALFFSASIQLGTLPVTEYSFFQIPLAGILLNLIVIPLMSVLLGCGITLSVFGNIAFITEGSGPAGAAAHMLGSLSSGAASLILRLYELMTSASAEAGNGLFICGRPEKYQIALYLSIITLLYVLFCVTEGRKRRLRNSGGRGEGTSEGAPDRRFAAACLLMIPLAVFCLSFRYRAELEVHAVSVGQGDCTLIFGRNRPCIMIDGGATDVKNTGKYRILPCLKAYGISTVDYVFISHFDADHVNGITELLEDRNCGVRLKRIIISSVVPLLGENENYEKMLEAAKAARREVPVFMMDFNDTIRDRGLCIACLGPDVKGSDAFRQRDLNDNSLILRLEDERSGFSAMFTGDMSREVEKELIRELSGFGDGSISGALSPVTYLKVAHHGSKTGSDEEFIKLLSPRVSTISCGRDNSYGHPHRETLETLSLIKGNRIFETPKCGEITIKLSAGRIFTECYKDD